DALQVLRRQVEQVPEPGRDALEIPDVRDGSGQLDVAHPVAANLAAGDLDAATLADDALESDALVLAAVALPVPRRTEDPLAEQPVLLRLQRAVVDGLRLLHLAVGPGTDLVRRRESDPELIEIVHVQHCGRRLLSRSSPSLRSTRSCSRSVEIRPRRLAAGQVDPQLLRRSEHVLVGLAKLDLLARARADLHVQA